VRQHHVTCAPATLSAISLYWKQPADHLEVAEEICYDGTPDYSERHWAQSNGWEVREFTVTWDAARALLDRDIAFTLATVQTGSAHLQAVIGYDARRGTFLIRDPYYRPVSEMLSEGLLEAHRSTGPRCMVLVPRAQAHLLDGIELPEAPLYDLLHRVNRALQEHNREAANAAYEEMLRAAPEHRLTLQARRALASYDADSTELLACADALLQQFPDDANLQLARLSYSRGFETRDQRLRRLREIAESENSDPMFWQQYAQELDDDAREHVAALSWINRSLRARPLEAGSLYILGNILWGQGKREEALQWYRFAASLSEHDEHLSRSYFSASCYFKQSDTVLRFLRNRFERFGKRSGHPARTLFWALNQVDHTEEAFRVLEDALQLRPDDGDLLLFAAGEQGRFGRMERACELLQTAQGKAAHTAWLRVAAGLAAYRGELKEALVQWQRVLETEPLSVDAHENVVRLLAETEHRDSGLAHLDSALERFSHHYALRRLRVEYLREHFRDNRDFSEMALNALCQLVEMNPADIWARREFVFALTEERRFEEALQEIDTTIGMAPQDSYSHSGRGEVLMQSGRWSQAKDAFREAIRLSVDNSFAIARLVRLCDTIPDQRAALEFIESELVRQTTFGDALFSYRDHASAALSAEELLASLQKALEARPDLWHAWSATVDQLLDMDRLDEALQVARKATEKFPLLPVLWVDLSHVYRARAEADAERAALEKALEISPAYGAAIRDLCAAHERVGRYEESKALLQAALVRDPLNGQYQAWLADTLWRMASTREEKEAAVEAMCAALLLDSFEGWAWESLRDWTGELDCSQRAAELARNFTQRRPGDARSWMTLARTLTAPDDLEERLQALARAIELRPRYFEAYDLRAELLCEAGRVDEALEACRPLLNEDGTDGASSTQEHIPSALRGRMAWIEAQRGEVEKAIEMMHSVVADDPNFYWGWRQLAHWYDNSGRVEEYLKAAREMARIAPQSAGAHGIVGDALLQSGDRVGAKREFARALAAMPDYSFAGVSLFDLQLEDNELDDASATIETVLRNTDDDHTRARAIQLAVQRNDVAGATTHLRAMCLSHNAANEEEAIMWAVNELGSKGWGKEVEGVLHSVLPEPQVRPVVGAAWAKACIYNKNPDFEKQLPALLERGEVGIRAMASCVESFAELKQSRDLRRFIEENRSTLRRHTETWGSTGYALYEISDNKGVIEWLSDWPQRADVKPWMLLNLAVCLRYTKRRAESTQVSRAASTLEHESGTSSHQAWIAFDEAYSGNAQEAQAALDAINGEELEPFYQFLCTMTQIMLEVQQSSDEERAAAFASARRKMKEARKEHRALYRQTPLMQQAANECIEVVSRKIGGIRGLLWKLFPSEVI
jgi:tetratricopeptide (TPR) repeat protein